MKHYSKPLHCSACLMVLLTVSGCSNNLLPNSTVNLMKSFVNRLPASILQLNQDIQQSINTPSQNNMQTSTASESTKQSYSFALQLTSVNSESGLAVTFKKMVKRAPKIFQGEPILNVEVVNLNGKTFYRLKYGGYKYLKNAQADCEAIKHQGIDCWVSNYTDNRVKF